MHQLSVPLNRQQLELIDRTLAKGLAGSRGELLRLALRDHMSRARSTAQPQRPSEAPR